MKRRHYPFSVEDESGKRYYYIDFGSEVHGRKSFRLWISPHLLLKDEEKGRYYVEFPYIGAKLKITQKGSKVLVPSVEFWTAEIFVPCGYRGQGSFEVIHPPKDELTIVKYYEFRSPRGSLGVGEGGLISIPRKYQYLKYTWQRTGRLYGEPPTGCTIVFQNGETREIDGVCLDEELIKELGL